MAQLMYEYALNHQLIEADKKFLIVNCSEYANNPELLTANLFGHKKGAFTGADKDNPGLIKLAEGGVLFLDEVHCLPPECQEKLFLFMDKGIYHMVGDNEKWYQSSLRLIFATTEKPEEVLLKTLAAPYSDDYHDSFLSKSVARMSVYSSFTPSLRQKKRVSINLSIFLPLSIKPYYQQLSMPISEN